MINIDIDDKSIKDLFKKMISQFRDGPKGAKAGYFKGDKGEMPGDEPNPPDIDQIAKWNEFGTYNIPPRPFVRNAQEKANKRCEKAVKALLDDGTDMETVTKQLAQLLVAELKGSIRKGNWAPNAPITINGGWMRNKKSGKWFFVKGKGSSKPLMDTGNLVQSVHSATITSNGNEIIRD